jgi:hypothetical protein
MKALGLVWGNIDSATTDLEEIRTRIDAPTQYGAQILVDHWRACVAGGGFVVGRDVPSRPLASVLRSLALYEPVEGMADFRVRLAGTAFMRRFGRDVTGLKLSEIYGPPSLAIQRSNLAQVIASSEPFIWDVTVARDDRPFLRYEAVRLPVLSPDRKERWVMGGLFYSDWT